MDQQGRQKLEQQLRQQWSQLYPEILDTFTTVSRSDLDSAVSVDDIVSRIADRTKFSETYVENKLNELVTSGVGSQGGHSSQRPFSIHAGRSSQL